MYFSNCKAISYGWEKAKENVWFFVKLFLVVFVVSFVFQLWINSVDSNDLLMVCVSNLSFGIVATLMSIGAVKIYLNIYDGVEVAVVDIIPQTHIWFKCLLTYVILEIVIILGLILFIIPGLYFNIRYLFVPYLIVDKNISIGDAFRLSSDMTVGVKPQLFLFILLMVGINIVGAWCFIGLFWTAAFSSMAIVYVYRELLKRVDADFVAIEKQAVDADFVAIEKQVGADSI